MGGKKIGFLSAVMITPSVIARSPSNLKEIEEEIKKLKQEAERCANYERQELFRLLEKRAEKAKKDKIYHLLEIDYQQTRNLLNSVTVNRNVVNNLHSSQNQQEEDGVWYNTVETQGFCTEETRHSSTSRVSVDEQAGTSRTQNKTEDDVWYDAVATPLTEDEISVYKTQNCYYFDKKINLL